jgi:hypothetical protein
VRKNAGRRVSLTVIISAIPVMTVPASVQFCAALAAATVLQITHARKQIAPSGRIPAVMKSAMVLTIRRR